MEAEEGGREEGRAGADGADVRGGRRGGGGGFGGCDMHLQVVAR